MPNSFKTPNIVLKEALMGFEDKFELAHVANHHFAEMLGDKAPYGPTGKSISLRRPGYPTVQQGKDFVTKDIEQETEAVVVRESDMRGTLFSVDSLDLAVDYTGDVRMLEQYTTGAAIASQVNINCYKEIIFNTPDYVFVDGSTLTFDNLSDLQQKMDDIGMPTANPTLCLNSASYNSLAKSIQSNTNFDQGIARKANQYMVGTYADFPLLRSKTLKTIRHTAGTASARDSIQFDSLGSSVDSLNAVINLKGATSGDTLKAGDRLQFTVTEKLNKPSNEVVGNKFQAVVKNNVTADGSGNLANVQIQPGITVEGGSEFFATVNAIPAQNEPVTIESGVHEFNVLTFPHAFTFATVPLRDISTLPGWSKSGNQKPNFAYSRNPNQPSCPFDLRLSYDSEITSGSTLLRLDVQPVYKSFVGYNLLLINKVA